MSANEGVDYTPPEGGSSPGTDYEAVAGVVDVIREFAHIAVAGLITDGFTDAEARAVVAGWMASMIPQREAEE